MPHIQITLTKGRTTEQKRQLAKRMADVLSEEMMADPRIFPSRWWKSSLTLFSRPASLLWIGEGARVEPRGSFDARRN